MNNQHETSRYIYQYITSILDMVSITMIKIQILTLVILIEYQNTKNIFEKQYAPNWLEEVCD